MQRLDDYLDELQELVESEYRRRAVAQTCIRKGDGVSAADFSDLARQDREAIARVRGVILALFETRYE